MEYIREMLLRQRTALARLMLGAGGRNTAEASSAPAHAGETDLPESGAGRRTAASGGRENARRAGGQQAVTAAAATGDLPRRERPCGRPWPGRARPGGRRLPSA